MKLLDLSHVISDGMVTYPGHPPVAISSHLSFEDSVGHYAEGTEFSIGRISMVGNTGTYLDTPAHRYRSGYDLSSLPLERCVGLPGVRVSVPGDGAIDESHFRGLDLELTAVLVHTGWDRFWAGPNYDSPHHPHLTEGACRFLVDAGAILVGIDSVNIDDTVGGARPAHTLLLAAEIPVVEHLTGLDRLPARDFTFTAVPPAVRGLATFPVRAFAAVGGLYS